MAATPGNGLNIHSAGIPVFDGTATFTETTTTQFNTLVGAAANAIANVSPGTSGQVLTSNGASANPTYQDNSPAFAASAVYGDGSDGSVTFDGTTVILGITPSGSNYTLARDLFLGSSTINNGVGIITNGFRIFCNGTLTNNGTIQWNGNAGTNAGVAGVALANTNSSINNGTGSTASGQAGGAGNTGAGSNGVNSGNTTFGGRGGTGGTGVSAGGNAGVIGAVAAGAGSIRSIPTLLTGQLFNGSALLSKISGGSGGGGGGGDAVFVGGGGGGGAGIIILSVWKFAGTGNIQANGGIGGNGAVGATNAGGGGGGGGGLINILSRSVVSAAISGQTISVSGGTGGTGTGLGATGSTGSSGTTVILFSL